jgi:hypothetical protein
MTLKPPYRRGLAAAAGGALVLGSGMSIGILAADMRHDWAITQADRDGAARLADEAARTPEPVVVIHRKVRHVTPDPVVVRKKVYGSARSAGTTSAGASASHPTRPSRRVLAPAPAPAKARTQAPAARTSKTS